MNVKAQNFSSLPTIVRGAAIVGFLMLLFLSLTVAAHHNATPEQQKSDDDVVALETRLTELFGLCQNNDLEGAASYFVYRGPDKGREWKDTLRFSDPSEKAAIKELCRRINGYTDKNQSYSFGAVKVERESEGEWHALEVSFYQGSEHQKAVFAFLLINGQFAIGDID